jgi:tetratricopeptide (TPR) repeat protein
MQKENFYELLENPGFLNNNTLSELQKITEEFPFFQAARLLFLKNLKEINHPDFGSELKKAAPVIPNRKQLFLFLYPKTETLSGNIPWENQNITPPEYALEDSEEKISGNSLVDKFLSSGPGPIKMDKTSSAQFPQDSDNEIETKSTTVHDELITETLALIYFEQKKYDEAIKAFQKLSLKYPEKSVYFASRIKEIEKIKNI